MTRLGSADPRQLGPYQLRGVLGSGGLGTVYLGRGTPRRGGGKHTVAVRAMRPELLRDRSLRARLRRVTQTVANEVDSPYVAGALDCELDSEHPWLAGEFVPGVALGTLITRYGPLPEDGVRALGGSLCRALAALHAARVTHRDLRAGNVLLTADSARLVDYGLGPGRTDLGADDEAAADPAADVFELGVLLCYAASAHLPFAASVLPTAREDPDLTGVPEGLHPALLACLHKTPESRPAPGPLTRLFDLADLAEQPAANWLPEPYVHEIDMSRQDARRLLGRRLFGR